MTVVLGRTWKIRVWVQDFSFFLLLFLIFWGEGGHGNSWPLHTRCSEGDM